MKATRRFSEYLKKALPEGYYSQISPDGGEVHIRNSEGYVYLFYKRELEEDFEACCALVPTILDLVRSK